MPLRVSCPGPLLRLACLGGGGPVPAPPYLAWGCGGGGRASPGGVPWGVRGRALSRPRLPALWAGCRGRCGASEVGRSPTPDCPPSGRAAGAGVGRPGSGALPAPTARPLGGLPGPVWGVRGRTLSHPRMPALLAGCRGRCGASGVGHSPTPDCSPSGRAAGAGVGCPGSDALPPPTARPLGGLPGPVWGVRGRALSHPRLLALWAGCRSLCGASGAGRSPGPACPPSGRAAGAGVGRPGSGALPPPTARPLGGLPGPVWGVRGRTLSHPRLPALWAGCRCRCGASGVGGAPTPDCSPSGRAAGAGVGRPGSGALPLPTARPLGGLPGPMWGVRGRTLSQPRLPALWTGCRGRCGASGVGRSPPPDCPPSGKAARAGLGRPGSGALPVPDCPPSGRAAGAGVGRPGSNALPSPTPRPLGGLPGPVWGVRGRALSQPRLPALWAGCRGRCGASGVGRSPGPDCPPSGRAAGAGVGRPGSGALPPPTARPLGGLPGPVWGVRGRALSHPRLPALWAGCRCRCRASGVGRSPTPDCPPSGKAAGAGLGRPGSDALPPPTARPVGGLPGLVWGVRGRTLSHPRSPALWAGCRGRCGASGVGRSPNPDCPPSGRAAGAGVGRPGSDALPPLTARPLGGLPGPVWGVRGRTLSHLQLPALWAGCRGRCGASGVGRSPTPNCPPSGRAAGAGVGRPGSGALPPPTARPLGGLPGPLWGVRGRTLSHPRLPALWAGCRGRCGASGVGRSPTPDCPPSGRAAGAGLGRPGSDALPPPTACPLGGLPGSVLGVRGRALSQPRLPALWAGCRGPCGASGAGRSPTPDCPPSGRAAGVGVGRPGSGALPPPTARPLGGPPGPVWGVRGRALSHPRLLALWAGCRGRCGVSGVGRSPTPDCPPSERAAGAGVGLPGSGALPPPTARPLGGLRWPVWGVQGRTLSPPPTARPLGGLPGPMWGVRGRALSHPQLLALWAGCRSRCGASGVGRSPTSDCPPSGRAAGAGVGRPGSGALPPPTARPLGGLPGPVWGVPGRALSHPRLLALWAGCRGRCGASGVGRSPTPDCSPSGRAAGAGVGRPGLDTLPPPIARPLGGLPGPLWGVRGWTLPHPRLPALWAGCRGVWGVRGRTLSHPRLPALWAGCRGRCGASGVGRSPNPRLPALWAGCRGRCGASGVGRSPTLDCPPSGRAAGAGVGRHGSGALPAPTARPLGGLPRPVWGVRGRALSHPRLPALWAGCRGRCGASGVGRSPTPDCSPSGRAAGAVVGRPGSDALPPPTARPLGGLPGPVWGVRGRTLSHPRLPALWAGCWGRFGASGVGRSPTPDCSPSGRAAGAGVGRPGSGARPPQTARPLGGLPGPVWGVRGWAPSHPRLLALWAGCRGRCGAFGVGHTPTPDCPPSGRAAGAGVGRPGLDAPPPPTARPLGGLPGRVGRPGSDALPPPTARPLGRLPGPVWVSGVGRSPNPRLPALWAGCRGRCGASGVGRSPTLDCPPSGRAAGAGVGRPGLDALPPPTARPLGGLQGSVWGVRGRALSHRRRPALWAGRQGRCGASGVGRSPIPDCPPSGRAAGAGVGRHGSGALPAPTARPLGGLPGPVWGVRGRTLSHPRLLALWAGCRGRCGASGVGRSPTPDCSPSGRAAGAAVGRSGSDALPPPTARPLGGLPGPVWGVRGRALSHPRLLALWAGCRGRCGASGVGRSPTPDCSPSGRAAGAGVGRPGLDALPSPTACPLGGLPGPVWGVRGRALSHPRLLALWAGCRGRCGASGVGRSPTPDCLPYGRAAGGGVGRPGSGALPPPTARPLGGMPGPVWVVRGWTLSHPRLHALWAGCRGWCGASGSDALPAPTARPLGGLPGRVGRPGSGALPPPTACPLGGLPGPVWGVRGRALFHPQLPALWAGCRGRCGASGVGRSPTPDCPPSGQAAGAGVGRPGSDALPPPTAHPLGGLHGSVWGVRGRALSQPRLPALWAGRRGRCGASGVGRSPTPDCSPSGRAAGAGVGCPGSDALPLPTARPLGGLPGPVMGYRGRALSHPRLPALWAGCRGLCGASGVGRSPTADGPPSGRAARAGVGRPGSGALPSPTARPLGGLPGPVWGVTGRALSQPRLLALWAGCQGRCGASGVGRSPTPDCPPSGRAAGAGVGRPGSGALPPPTARPLGGLTGPPWGVRGRTLSHPRLPALWAGCRGRCGASGVGRSPTPDCSPSGRAAGAGVGRPGSGALPPPTARPLGGLPGPVWGVRGWTLSHPRLPALWAGCRGRCGASGVGRSPTPDCSPSGRAAGAGVGRPGLDALPPPTACPMGGLPGPVWGVRGRALSHPRLLALWAGCWGRCGSSGVGHSPTPDCTPSGRAARAGVGRPGSDALPAPTARPLGGLPGRVGRPGSGALPPPTACPLGGLPGPVWGVRGRALSHPQLPALWAGCRGRCGASGVGRSPTPDCPPSGQAAGAGVGRPGSDALPPPTARPLGGLHGSVWGVRGRALSQPRLPALWAGRRGRCGASGVGRSPTPDCSPSGRAAGAGVGCPGSDALPPPTARPLGGLPGPVMGYRGRALSHPRLLALWAGCRGRCGASGVGRSPTPDCPPSGRAAGAGVGRPGSGALPPLTARPLGGLPGPVWGVRGWTLSHPRLAALWAGCGGRCGASMVGRSPTPDCSPSGRAAGAGVGRPGLDTLPPPTARPLGGLPGRVGRPGSGALPPRTARPLGGLLRPVWGVRGRALFHPRLPALWAGCRGRCGASGVGRSPTPDCPPSGRAAGAGVGRPGSDALPPPTARPLGGLQGLVWGVRGRVLSHPRLPALWAGRWGRCGASGVGRSPTPDCSPSGRAAGAGVGRPGSGALPPPTARPLGGLPGPVWGVRGLTLSHPRLLALWAGCRGR